jgi:hypothetical protein
MRNIKDQVDKLVSGESCIDDVIEAAVTPEMMAYLKAQGKAQILPSQPVLTRDPVLQKGRRIGGATAKNFSALQGNASKVQKRLDAIRKKYPDLVRPTLK